MRWRAGAASARALAAAAMAALVLNACGPAEPDPAEPSSAPAQADLAPVPGSPTLDRVKARRRLRCGVTEDLPGFAERTLTGQWRGFDVDLCRAVAAAVLGDARSLSIVALTSRTRFAALQSGAVDLLAGGAAFTFTHDVSLGLNVVGISFYDSQGFMTAAPKPPRVRPGQAPPPTIQKTIADLNGARICVEGGSAEQQVLAEGLRARGLSYQPIVKDDRDQALQAYRQGQCDAITDSLALLAFDRSTLRDPDGQTLLGETLADDPMGPLVRQGDDRWAGVVRWTLNALILAEQNKLDAHSVDEARRDSVDPGVRRLLGVEGDAGRRLGLPDDWAYRAIRQVGDYGEIFERNLGQGSPLKLDRGRNALWTADKPGQLYAPPLR